MANTFTKVYKKIANNGNVNDYSLVAQVGVGGVPLQVLGAASASANGVQGLVPAPTSGNQSKFLRGDATWATPTNTTYATTGEITSGSTSLITSGAVYTKLGLSSSENFTVNGTTYASVKAAIDALNSKYLGTLYTIYPKAKTVAANATVQVAFDRTLSSDPFLQLNSSGIFTAQRNISVMIIASTHVYTGTTGKSPSVEFLIYKKSSSESTYSEYVHIGTNSTSSFNSGQIGVNYASFIRSYIDFQENDCFYMALHSLTSQGDCVLSNERSWFQFLVSCNS